MPKISLENNDSNNPGNINTMSNKIACMPLKRQNLLKFWFLATPKYAAKNGIKFPKGNVATIFTIGKSGCNIIIAAGNAAKKYREYRNPDISGSKYGRNATTRSETGTRDVPPAFGTNDAPALLFDRVDLKVTTTPSARDVDDDEEEDKDKEDDEFARPPKDAAAIPEKATTGLFFFDLAVPEKTALVTKWVKVAKREEEKEDAEAEEKKFEAIKRVPYGTKSTTKETTE